MRYNVAIIVGLVFFVAAGFYLERSPRFAELKENLQPQTIPGDMLNYGALGKLLKQLAVVRTIPNDSRRYPISSENQIDLSANIFQKKRHVGSWLYQANSGGPGDFPSTQAIRSEDFRKEWPLLSIVVDPNDLNGPKGIVSNPDGRGREWEKLAYVSYFDEHGQLDFATSAGIRLHGGDTRKSQAPWRSFRLYFRDDYGADQFKPDLLFGPQDYPIKRLVVHDDRPKWWPFVSYFAFDIARRCGCVVPKAKQVRFFLNGENQALYFLTEHLSKTQWRYHFGHDNFVFFPFKGQPDPESRQHYSQLTRWAHDRNVKMTMANVAQKVDLDNLTAYLISIIFCGTSDGYQGIAVLDLARPDAKWFWINWDMDHSFRDVYKRDRQRQPWEQDALELVLGRSRRDVRAILFKRLLSEDPKYRFFFISKMMDCLNHRISSQYLAESVDRFEALLGSLGSYKYKSIDELRDYVAHRPDFIRKQLQEIFRVDSFCRVDLTGPAGLSYQIDGFEHQQDYQGWYAKGMPISLAVTPEHKGRFSHWEINGKPFLNNVLKYNVISDTQIHAVLK